ncbi:hypothetical protein GCM10007874_67390 [Labrys miyagiensis]|uniref:Invasion associated locus B family protein n=1 Tax=Labrys miyagiensis TaxID=346912 RepID=A0ABQ6CTM4_9HYPH|nr:hypothetical protein [Labrys miyagiensis]GLS23718.1 hypothetical protein GCM10007874_67390 [Labrys miyagiensis]
MAGRRLLALALLCLGGSAATAAPRLAVSEGFSLRFDDSQWARQTAAPPSLLTLRCIAPECSPGNVLTFVRDERPLIVPGFAPFGPGAGTGASVDLRLQSLTPASRLLARGPAEPVTLGGADGYRGVYDIEDRALAKTAAVILLLRQGHGTLEVRLGAPKLSQADIAAFNALLTGFELQN